MKLLTLLLLTTFLQPHPPRKVSYIVVKYYNRQTKQLTFADTIKDKRRF